MNYTRDGLLPEIYDKATVDTVEQALQSAAKIGYPVMIKASEGGGGKGIRKVTEESELEAAFRQVRKPVLRL